MRKPFEAKVFSVEKAADDVRVTAQRIGAAAETQATLNLALTAVCVALVVILVAGGRDR